MNRVTVSLFLIYSIDCFFHWQMTVLSLYLVMMTKVMKMMIMMIRMMMMTIIRIVMIIIRMMMMMMNMKMFTLINYNEKCYTNLFFIRFYTDQPKRQKCKEISIKMNDKMKFTHTCIQKCKLTHAPGSGGGGFSLYFKIRNI
jgi:hypothetical protein